jgi:hypothetical protein
LKEQHKSNLKMLKSKSYWTCSFCSKIFKHPIELPCEHSICREHLSERDVVKEKRIKCKECNGEFQIKDNQFKSNEAFKKLIESHSYLSGEELSLKQDLEVSVRKFFEFYEDLNQNKSKLESDVFEHFEEIRFQIDEQRERLKVKIDGIALAMIDEIKKHEAMCMKHLKVRFSSLDDSKSLQIKLSELEDTFRHPDLLVETIKEMQQKQEESLNEIQLKLSEMNQVKDILSETNSFIPNLTLLNQEGGTSLFGSIRLYEFTNTNPFKSEILSGERQSFELVRLCEFSPNDKWSLLYRGTRDGFGAKDFHSRCDGHANTLTILKVNGSSNIFGGFTSVSWQSSAKGYFKSDANAFIFSLTNKENRPLKMKIDPNRHKNAIGCHSECGPTFGGFFDIKIANNANTTMDSFSNLGKS